MTIPLTVHFGAQTIRTALLVSAKYVFTGIERRAPSSVQVADTAPDWTGSDTDSSVRTRLSRNTGERNGSEFVDPLVFDFSFSTIFAPSLKAMVDMDVGSVSLPSTVSDCTSNFERMEFQSNPNEYGLENSAKNANSKTSHFRYGTEGRKPVSQLSFRTYESSSGFSVSCETVPMGRNPKGE